MVTFFRRRSPALEVQDFTVPNSGINTFIFEFMKLLYVSQIFNVSPFFTFTSVYELIMTPLYIH